MSQVVETKVKPQISRTGSRGIFYLIRETGSFSWDMPPPILPEGESSRRKGEKT